MWCSYPLFYFKPAAATFRMDTDCSNDGNVLRAIAAAPSSINQLSMNMNLRLNMTSLVDTSTTPSLAAPTPTPTIMDNYTTSHFTHEDQSNYLAFFDDDEGILGYSNNS